MNAQVPNRISVTTNPRFWDHFVASLLLIRYQRVFIVFHMVFPLFGAFLLMTPFLGYRLGPIEILLAFFCFSFTPLIIALAVWAAGRQNKLAHGPITYVFDSEMVQLRPGSTPDLDFFKEMLFEAFFWDTSARRPLFNSFHDTAEFSKLLVGWGRRGDRAIVADEGGTRIGAAWFRLWTPELHSYGFVDAATPEIAMAVGQEYRSKGVGRRLLDALVEMARADGVAALSLSVSPLNFARQFYESAGFRKVGESGTSWTLLLPLRPLGYVC